MYKKFSDNEIIDAYETMLSYSGKASKEIMDEIKARGSLSDFKKKIEQKNAHNLEIERLSKEIYLLTSSDTNLEFVKKFITSDVIQKDELDKLAENRFSYYQSFKKNKEINFKTLINSIIGTILGSILGAVFLWVIVAFFIGLLEGIPITLIVPLIVVPIYLINYFTLKYIVKKTRANPVVFISAVVGTTGSFFISMLILKWPLF